MHFLLCLFFLGAQIRLNDQILDIEVASTQEERARGLMEREDLPDGNGMLFIYPEPRILSFWMKNTLIPLSIGFFDQERRLINIEEMNPPAGDNLPTYKSRKPAQYALEVPQGWFERHGVRTKMTFEWESGN
jgi:uncharacterized protein